jgi:hypothetical protein
MKVKYAVTHYNEILQGLQNLLETVTCQRRKVSM